MVKYKSILIQDFIREILKSKGRFVSILLIVALGVGFYAGVKGTGYDMKVTLSKYYEDSNFMDASIVSTMGLTSDDIRSISENPIVSEVVGSKQVDVIMQHEEKKPVIRAHSFNPDLSMNQFTLVSGRLPENPGECLMEDLPESQREDEGSAILLGETIELSEGKNQPAISEVLKHRSYKVVGTITTPQYFSFTRGNTTIGSGSVRYFMFLPESEFLSDIFAYAYVKTETPPSENTFTEAYDQATATLKTELETVAQVRMPQRSAQIKKDAQEEIDKAKKELEDQRAENSAKLNDAKAELDAGKRQLDAGEAEYQSGLRALNAGAAEGEAALRAAQQRLDVGEVAYAENLSLLNQSEAELVANASVIAEKERELNAAEAQLLSHKGQLDAAAAQIQTLRDTINLLENQYSQSQDPSLFPQIDALTRELEGAEATFNPQLEEFERNMAEITAGKAALAEPKNQLESGRAQLANARSTLNAGRAEFEAGRAELNAQTQSGRQELARARITLNQATIDFDNGMAEYEAGRREFDTKIAGAQTKIDDAQQKIDDLSEAEWTITNRNEFPETKEYVNNSDRINSIASVFPVFFLAIAALVCLTTMTRMVEEERLQIGTLKALGYSRTQVVMKYLLYALLASFFGSVLGLAVGFTLFPSVIFSAYSAMMYRMPPVVLKFQPILAFSTSLVAIAITTLAGFYSCLNTLRDEPAALMRPPAPKPGKRILLERVTIIWKKLSFTQKVTVRNLFRYKKRMLMSIIGITGCTALMLTGFALKDSISSIAQLQFQSIFKYDMSLILDPDNENFSSLPATIESEPRVVDSLSIVNLSAQDFSANEKSYAATLSITDDPESLTRFVNLRNRQSEDKIPLTDDGVVITEKLSRLLSLSVGDTISVARDGKTQALEVTGIMENYVDHFVFMTESLYNTHWNDHPEHNTKMLLVDDPFKGDKEAISDIANQIMVNDSVVTILNSASILDSMKDQLTSLNTVILVLVVSASLLAFVVLYNLTNINITERFREIATIKVLGFFDNETSTYVYRENMILSFIGSITGLVAGVFLTRFIIVTAEMNDLMFGRTIQILSFIYAFALTFAFSYIVKFATYFKLQKIDMVEALKSVD